MPGANRKDALGLFVVGVGLVAGGRLKKVSETSTTSESRQTQKE